MIDIAPMNMQINFYCIWCKNKWDYAKFVIEAFCPMLEDVPVRWDRVASSMGQNFCVLNSLIIWYFCNTKHLSSASQYSSSYSLHKMYVVHRYLPAFSHLLRKPANRAPTRRRLTAAVMQRRHYYDKRCYFLALRWGGEVVLGGKEAKWGREGLSTAICLLKM